MAAPTPSDLERLIRERQKKLQPSNRDSWQAQIQRWVQRRDWFTFGFVWWTIAAACILFILLIQ